MDKISHLPFGLQYEEHPIAKDFVISTYDDDEDISVVIDGTGNKIPSVECFGNLGTRTATKVANEGTEEDPGSFSVGGTRTLTEVKSESSDSDEDRFSLFLGTRTDTFVQSEQSDEDPGIDIVSRPPLTTKTMTKVAREDTDED